MHSLSLTVTARALLTAATVLSFSACGGKPADDPFGNALGWDLHALPSFGRVLREVEVDGGGLIQVTGEGAEEPVAPSTPMTLHYEVYTLDGVRWDRGVLRKYVMNSKRECAGLNRGLVGIKKWERRRILVPVALAATKEKRRSPVPSGKRLVFDVVWAELKIEDLQEGTGVLLSEGSAFRADYRLTLDNGEVVADSFSGDAKIEGVLKAPGLISGFVDGVKGMRVGGRRKIWVPWHRGFPRRRDKIPMYSNLTFVVQLLDAKPAK